MWSISTGERICTGVVREQRYPMLDSSNFDFDFDLFRRQVLCDLHFLKRWTRLCCCSASRLHCNHALWAREGSLVAAHASAISLDPSRLLSNLCDGTMLRRIRFWEG